jgi:hypothetical protein
MTPPVAPGRSTPATLEERIKKLQAEIAGAKQRLAPTLDLDHAMMMLHSAERTIRRAQSRSATDSTRPPTPA